MTRLNSFRHGGERGWKEFICLVLRIRYDEWLLALHKLIRYLFQIHRRR